jgi:hypothetical protein
VLHTRALHAGCLGSRGFCMVQGPLGGMDEMAKALFGAASAALGKESGKRKLGGALLPAYAQEPVVLRRGSSDDTDFFDGNDGDWAKLRVENPDSGLRQIEIDRAGLGVRRERTASETTAVEDEVRAKLLDGFGGSMIAANWGKEHGEQEKHKTDRSKSPSIPEAQWKDHEAGTDEAERDAKSGPSAGGGAKRKELRKSLRQLEERASGGVAEASDTGDGFGGRQVAGKKRRVRVIVHAGPGGHYVSRVGAKCAGKLHKFGAAPYQVHREKYKAGAADRKLLIRRPAVAGKPAFSGAASGD